MSRICVCGAFRLWDVPKGGQEVKTCILTDALEAKYGKIYRVDTLAKNSRFLMPFQLVWAMMTCKDINTSIITFFFGNAMNFLRASNSDRAAYLLYFSHFKSSISKLSVFKSQ